MPACTHSKVLDTAQKAFYDSLVAAHEYSSTVQTGQPLSLADPCLGRWWWGPGTPQVPGTGQGMEPQIDRLNAAIITLDRTNGGGGKVGNVMGDGG